MSRGGVNFCETGLPEEHWSTGWAGLEGLLALQEEP